MRAAKLDSNHKDISDALEARGHQVRSLAKLGDGAPDLLVGARRPTTRYLNGIPTKDFDRVLVALEIKRVRNLRGDLEKLTPLEEKFHRKWKGWPVYVVGTVGQAIDAVEGRT